MFRLPFPLQQRSAGDRDEDNPGAAKCVGADHVKHSYYQTWAASVLPPPQPRSSAKSTRMTNVPTQSSPLKGDASRTRPALNLIAQAIDQTCYWKKIESGSDGNHHQPGERHSPVIPTSHRFLPVRIRCHGATAPVLRRACAVPPPCWGLVFSRSQRARKGHHLSPASCQTGSVSEGAEGATPAPLPNNGPAT
jgi:hypothetical protein